MKHARVIVAPRLQGETYKEIAEELDLTEYNVENCAAITWKQGLFDSTFFTKPRGRDSFEPVFRSHGFSAIPDAMSTPVNDL